MGMNNSKFLTIGSGPYYMDGWLNLDLYADDADVKASMFDMPLPDNHYTKVYGGHVLEHIEYNSIPLLMKEISRVAADQAEIIFVGPDIDKAVLTDQPHWLLEAIIRNPASAPGAGHEWSSSEYQVLQMLNGHLNLGFEPYPLSSTLKPHWPNPTDASWQYCVRGINER